MLTKLKNEKISSADFAGKPLVISSAVCPGPLVWCRGNRQGCDELGLS
jgi:hypothetical protein